MYNTRQQSWHNKNTCMHFQICVEEVNASLSWELLTYRTLVLLWMAGARWLPLRSFISSARPKIQASPRCSHCDSRVAIWSLTYERSQLAQIAILLYLGYITTEYEEEEHQYTNTRQVLWKLPTKHKNSFGPGLFLNICLPGSLANFHPQENHFPFLINCL